jgi:hypothetical protein
MVQAGRFSRRYTAPANPILYSPLDEHGHDIELTNKTTIIRIPIDVPMAA